MIRPSLFRVVLCAFVGLVGSARVSWSQAPPAALPVAGMSDERLQLAWTAWFESHATPVENRQKILAAHSSDATLDRLERIARTAAQIDPRAAQLVDACQRPFAGQLLDVAWLKAEDVPAPIRDHLRLYYARWLAHERLYDELVETLAGLKADDVVDPSTLLFYQSVGFHRMLDREAGLRSVNQLLAIPDAMPQRFRALAELMRSDLEALEDESLDHIARRMDDIRRRLDLGRAGTKVVKIEKGVIESLDKLIKEMEDQQQQQQGDSGGAGNLQPSSPAQDSKIAGGKGPGEVDRKNIGNTAGWGDLPPKQREAALQQIGKDFPPHYRDVIEQYFRKLASEGSSAPARP